ncbi:phage head-tail joining protein [Pseudogemmobacter sonorensis]|uniref:phage head-tail joining protein n=1 Tax=Pseudogemmobacter sonorensis TaxID=2989681 RepID=UPI003695157E
MPPFETLLAMSGFALAASATPGPVNIIGAMTGARYGAARALAFVTGATASFLVLFLAFGTGTRFSGVRTVRDQNGEEVTYRSQSEIERAIAAIDSEIATLQRGRLSLIRVQSSKGL